MDNQPVKMEKAVVIGASVSGLLAARVLANHFSKVTVIERDVLPPLGEPRKGVPQGRHAHLLLAHGRDLLESFFPGLTQELASRGATVGDLSEMGVYYSNGAYNHSFHSGLVAVQVSRPMLEGSIARRLLATPNVTLLENHDAVGLLTTPSTPGAQVQVRGVKVENRTGGAPVESSLEADLVVDAAGRGSRCLAWLEGLGFARPEEEHIKMDLCYTTRVFRRRPTDAGGRSPIIVLPTLKIMRGGTMLAVEGERWIITLAGYLGDAAPTDMAGYLEYARSFAAPDIYEFLKTAEPLGEASQYKYPASQRRHFEKLNRFPEGYLACGDVVCSFNPIYGQGMTTAASEAALLDECLQAGLPGLARRFFNRAGRLLDAPWSMAAGGDLAYPQVEGKRTRAGQLVGLYLARLLAVALEDSSINLAFQKVTNLTEPPTTLFHPKIVIKVLFGRTKS